MGRPCMLRSGVDPCRSVQMSRIDAVCVRPKPLMKLLPVPESLLRLGQPLPAPIRDPKGQLLVARGSVLADEAQRQRILGRQPHALPQELERLQQPWVQALGRMVLRNETLDRIARWGTSSPGQPGATHEGSPESPGAVGGGASSSGAPSRLNLPDRCDALRSRLAAVLRSPTEPEVAERLAVIVSGLRALVQEDADAVLMVLLHDAALHLRDYGVRHTLVVAALVCLVAQDHPEVWPAETADRLVAAALTMNLSILKLQDQMAVQVSPPTADQRQALQAHGARSAEWLLRAGVTHRDWLQAVSGHRPAHPEGAAVAPIDPEGARWARLLHKADVFAAALSPRKVRPGLSATAAARVAFLDHSGQTDEFGAWIVKTVGLYPPGTLVALNNHEIGLCIRRGPTPSSPWVAALVAPSGNPLAEPLVRDTSQLSHRVVRAVPLHEARIRVPMEAVLKCRLPQAARGSQDEAEQQRGR